MLQSEILEELLRPLETAPDPVGQIKAVVRSLRAADAELRAAVVAIRSAIASGERGHVATDFRDHAFQEMIVSLQAAQYALQRVRL